MTPRILEEMYGLLGQITIVVFIEVNAEHLFETSLKFTEECMASKTSRLQLYKLYVRMTVHLL
jgi:hypothetical protein